MTTANKVTLARMALIPVFLIVLMSGILYADYIALVIFAVAALTDGIDGHIARKYNQITDFGKFLDPLADKLLIATALICFVELGRMPAWMAVIIIAREFIVTGLRSIAASKGVIIAAIMTGKVKTCIQIGASLCAFVLYAEPFVIGGKSVAWYAMLIATLFTIYSGYEYLKKNWNIIAESK
ncbi:MAG: CDP-diacylglycerol--glycerol-3-phosphate 3-phosphatidyltransferase [Clostridia bacterium]|nr:CDP-diacylglycerol--glycerol-3-phosphate 3-phosphatidyltransferase [Clostridia bacterium]